MTLISDQLDTWQHSDLGWGAWTGAEVWDAAWLRTRSVVDPLWPGRDVTWDGIALAEGATALATAIYILARQRRASVNEVHRQDVEDLASKSPPWQLVSEWEEYLRRFGHDVVNPDCRVAAVWRVLRKDCTPPIAYADGDLGDLFLSDPANRWGPAIASALPRVLAPRWELVF